MRQGWMLFAGLFLGMSFWTPFASAEEDERVAWLARHAVKVASIDPDNEDFSDLQPLKKIIGKRRLVQLGEESHGDGACFLAKARLIKFLHKEMGFDVIAFESGLYDCRKAWEAYQRGEPGLQAGQKGIFGIWTMSHEVGPTLAYLAGTVKTKRPLELCGFDCQLTSRSSREHLATDLEAAVRTHAPAAGGSKDLTHAQEAIATMLDGKAHFDTASAGKAERAFAALGAAFRDGAGATGESGYWAQLCDSLAQQVASDHQRSKGAVKGARANNIRDAQMARNLIWLVDEHFADRKVIVWAATSHLMRNPDKVKPTQGEDPLEGYAPMGHAVWKHFGDRQYTLGFTAYEGSKGYPTTGRVFPIGTAPADSLDDLCRRAGLQNAIIDLRAPPSGGAWLQKPFITRPLGYANMRGLWHEVLDGLFVQREMTPSTRDGYTPAKDIPDIGPLVEERWRQIRSGLDRKNMWANKWTLDSAFEKWAKAHAPEPTAIEAQEPQVRDFLKENAKDEEAVWRAHALLAAMAKARGDAAEALKQYDEALEHFPKHDIPRAEMTSQFHHLVRKRAFLLWDEKGLAAARKYALGKLAKDRRMRTLYLPDWEARLEGKASSFRKALEKAYKNRKKRFKDLRDEIDRFLAALD